MHCVAFHLILFKWICLAKYQLREEQGHLLDYVERAHNFEGSLGRLKEEITQP